MAAGNGSHVSGEPVLEVQDLTRAFGGVLAVSHVSFGVPAGQTLGVIGPNGSGKTTLFNLITGVMRPTQGDVRILGRSIRGLRPSDVCRLGISRTYQEVRTFASMSVLDNVAVAASFGTPGGLSARAARAKAAEIIEEVGIADLILRNPADLNLFQRKQVQLARALATSPKILLLDEQMAGLAAGQIELATAEIRAVKARYGLTLILIEHLMEAISGLADRTVVLESGRLIADGPTVDVLRQEEVLTAYLGASDAPS